MQETILEIPVPGLWFIDIERFFAGVTAIGCLWSFDDADETALKNRYFEYILLAKFQYFLLLPEFKNKQTIDHQSYSTWGTM